MSCKLLKTLSPSHTLLFGCMKDTKTNIERKICHDGN